MKNPISEAQDGQLAISLEEAIGRENVTRFPDLQVDGLKPSLLVKPGGRSETAHCLEICSRANVRIVPAGMMTWLECGNPVRSADVVLSLARMNKVVDYSPADLTIWAEAGMTMNDVNRATRMENQWLPLDPPGDGTLGAVVACGSSGPLRFGYGTPRDYVIGLKLAHLDGTETKSGGRVVKNVAGYDLNKLYVGSFGTLAVITEVILKLRPVPETSSTVIVIGIQPESVESLAKQILMSRLRPASLFALNQPMSSLVGLGARGMTMMIRFLESQIAVAYQVGRLRALLDGIGCPSSVTGSADSDLWSQVGNLDATSAVALKCSVAVSNTARAIDLCEKRFPSSTLAADLAMGLVRLGIGSGDQEIISQVTALRSEIELIGGTLIIERAPRFIRLAADAWGETGPEVEIMRAIKQKYDPNSVLSPGRFVSGI